MKKILKNLLLTSLFVFSGITATCGTQYFAPSKNNSVTGGTIGIDLKGNPFNWASLHSQYNGSHTSLLRIGPMANANWTFLWTRKQGDNNTYKVIPQFNISKEYQGKVVLEVGFDRVYHHTQKPWPKGYWVSRQNSTWIPAIDATQEESGRYELNKKGEAITVSPEIKKLYIRLRLTRKAFKGFTLIQTGRVTFKESKDEDSPVVVGPSEVVNVVTAGADPTGERDSFKVIQKALDRGGIVFIPAGTYKIMKKLTITQSNTELRGERGSVICVPAGTPISAIDTNPVYGIWKLKNITIKNLTFINNKANYKIGDNLQGTHAIGMFGVTDSRVENCFVKDFQHDGICVYSCKNVDVVGCTSDGPRHGITVNGQYEGGRYGNWNIRIDRCHTLNTWDTGIVIGFQSFYVTVTNSVIERSRCHGIDIFCSSHIIVSDNVIRNWNSLHYKNITHSSVGIFVHPDWGLTTAIPTSDVIVKGNIIMYDVPVPSGCEIKSVEVTGNTDSVVVSSNEMIGGYCAFFLREQPYDHFYKARPDKRKAMSEVPRNVIFSNNICRGQKGPYLWISSASHIPALITNNIFAPAPGGKVVVSLPRKSDVVMKNNIFRDNAIQNSSFKDNMISKTAPVEDGKVRAAQ